jgi:hypothetical protein
LLIGSFFIKVYFDELLKITEASIGNYAFDIFQIIIAGNSNIVRRFGGTRSC